MPAQWQRPAVTFPPAARWGRSDSSVWVLHLPLQIYDPRAVQIFASESKGACMSSIRHPFLWIFQEPIHLKLKCKLHALLLLSLANSAGLPKIHRKWPDAHASVAGRLGPQLLCGQKAVKAIEYAGEADRFSPQWCWNGVDSTEFRDQYLWTWETWINFNRTQKNEKQI